MVSMFHEDSLKQPFLGHNEEHRDKSDVHQENPGSKKQELLHSRRLIFFLTISHIPTIGAIIFLLLSFSKYALEQECAHPDFIPCKYRKVK